MKQPKLNAFTLIEVLITIAIVAIVVGIAIPSLGWIKTQAIETKKNYAISRVAEAKTQYYQENRTNKRFRADHETTNTSGPHIQELAKYLQLPPGVGKNAFYSNQPQNLCEGCFPPNQVWYLNPNDKDKLPFYEKLP